MQTQQPKRTYILITDPALIASIERNERGDLIGGKDKFGQYWSVKEHLAKYRRECGQNGEGK